MRRFRNGDPDAVREVYQRYHSPMFTVAHRALGDRGLAEEAVQQAFLQAWRASARLDPELDPAPWLYTITRRVAVDLYRRERRQHSELGEPEVAVLPQTFEGMWEAWEVRTALMQLPPDEREVLFVTHFLGLSHEQAADRIGIPIGTVKSRSHRAHRHLAGLLEHLKEATG